MRSIVLHDGTGIWKNCRRGSPSKSEWIATGPPTRRKLSLADNSVDLVLAMRELHGMKPGERKMLADVVYGAQTGATEAEVDEQLRWFGIAPTEEEEERIARGETLTFLINE